MATAALNAVHGIPSPQLGEILHNARTRRDLSLEEVARRLQQRFTPTTLTMIESGRYPLTEHDLSLLLAAYGIDIDALAPRTRENALAATGPTPPPFTFTEVSEEAVLIDYLTFVYAMRAQAPGSDIPLRDEDIEVLARSLDLPAQRIERRLRKIMRRWRKVAQT